MTNLPQPARQPRSHPPTVALALFVGTALSAAFVGLVAVVIPGVLLMVFAGFGLLLFFVLQYFLWAKWLYPVVVRLERESTADPAGQIPGLTSEVES